MKSLLQYLLKHIKIIIPLSLAGLITITWFHVEKVSFFEKTIVNIGGTIQTPVLERIKAKEDNSSNEYTETDKITSEKDIDTSNVAASALVPNVKTPPINNSAATAFWLENNSEYSDNLFKKDEKRFYKLKLDSNSTVTIFFSASGMSSYKLNIQDGNTMNMEFEVYEESNFTKKMDVYLKTGTYTIKITGGKSWKKNNVGNKYQFMAQISSSENSEAEMNNTKQTANIISTNTEIKASSYKNDVDYFTFTLDKTSSVLPMLDFAEVDNFDLKLYELRLEYEYGGVIKKFIFIGNNQLSGKKKYVNLKPGNYLVRVSRIEESKLELGFREYTLRVYSEI